MSSIVAFSQFYDTIKSNLYTILSKGEAVADISIESADAFERQTRTDPFVGTVLANLLRKHALHVVDLSAGVNFDEEVCKRCEEEYQGETPCGGHRDECPFVWEDI